MLIVVGEDEFLRLVDTLPPTLLNEAPIALAQLQQQANAASLGPSSTNHTAVSVFAARLAFLSEFRDYLLYLGQGARDRAAGKLVGMLTAGIAPVGVWAVLLAESVPLLEGGPLFFFGPVSIDPSDPETLLSSNDTFELLRILEEVLSNSTFAPTEYLYQLILYLDCRSAPNSTEQNASAPDANTLVNGNGKGVNKAGKGTMVDASNKGVEETMKRGVGEARRKLEEVRLAIARNLSRALLIGFDNPF